MNKIFILLLAISATLPAQEVLLPPRVVQEARGYNSWPMIQAIGEKLVCVYSRGTGHTIGEDSRAVYARTSTDGGRLPTRASWYLCSQRRLRVIRTGWIIDGRADEPRLVTALRFQQIPDAFHRERDND